MPLINVADVRRVIGMSSTDQISDDDINASIKEAENKAEHFLNAFLTPREVIETYDGNSNISLVLNKNPVLSVRQLKIDTYSITIAGNLFVSRPSGKITLNAYGSPEVNNFIGKPNAVRVKYVTGWVEPSTRSTTTTGALTAGSSVSCTVSDSQGFYKNDWVEIYSMDGFRECAQITNISSNTLTLDTLAFTHESGSVVNKLEVPEAILHLVRCLAGLICLGNLIGASYATLNAYTMGEFSSTRADPFLKFKEVIANLQNQANESMRLIVPRPAVF